MLPDGLDVGKGYIQAQEMEKSSKRWSSRASSHGPTSMTSSSTTAMAATGVGDEGAVGGALSTIGNGEQTINSGIAVDS